MESSLWAIAERPSSRVGWTGGRIWNLDGGLIGVREDFTFEDCKNSPPLLTQRGGEQRTQDFAVILLHIGNEFEGIRDFYVCVQ
jgi:hypothetical protein